MDASSKEVVDEWMELGREVEEALRGYETNADIVRASPVLSAIPGLADAPPRRPIVVVP
jgi:hypothetical protein